VFPTGVGMNRIPEKLKAFLVGVPHRRGDEPPYFMPCFVF